MLGIFYLRVFWKPEGFVFKAIREGIVMNNNSQFLDLPETLFTNDPKLFNNNEKGKHDGANI